MANQTITISKTKVSVLPIPERINDWTQKFHIDSSDVALGTGSSDTVTVTLGTTPPFWVVAQAMAVVTTAFAGTTAFTVVVGTTTTTNAFLASASTLTAGVLQNTNGIGTVNTPASSIGTSSLTIQALFTNATGGSPSALTAGAMDIYITMYDPTKLDVAVTG